MNPGLQAAQKWWFQARAGREAVWMQSGAASNLKASLTDAANQKSAQACLQAIEDLRKSGLITDKEAEAKQKDILNGL